MIKWTIVKVGEETDLASSDNNANKDSKSEEVILPKSLSHIKNKDRRRENLLRLKATERKIKIEAKKRKKALEKALGDKAPPKQVGLLFRTDFFVKSGGKISVPLPS